MTPKEQTDLTRHITRRVKPSNTSLEAKQMFYSGFLDGMEQTPDYIDKNLTDFCTILDRLIAQRRKKR